MVFKGTDFTISIHPILHVIDVRTNEIAQDNTPKHFQGRVYAPELKPASAINGELLFLVQQNVEYETRVTPYEGKPQALIHAVYENDQGGQSSEGSYTTILHGAPAIIKFFSKLAADEVRDRWIFQHSRGTQRVQVDFLYLRPE
eukprot:2055277-Rhodomonas_salina.1